MSFGQNAIVDHGDLRERFEARGHGHVFAFVDELDEASRERLGRQLRAIDVERLAKIYERVVGTEDGAADALEPPVGVLRTPEHGGAELDRWRAAEAGEALLAAGRVAALLVAGGQGTRLGHPGPKGSFPLGPVSGRTLFGLQAQKLAGLGRRYGKPVPWLVMTSPATHRATRALFEHETWFGLRPEDVTFFQQQELPCVDFEGRLILEAPDRVASAPEGHGSALPALADSGSLRDLRDRGVHTLFYYQVDNPLVRMCDPVLIGHHALRGAEMTCKVVSKRAPDERVGTAARRSGRPCVVEYTEVREPARSARDDDGELIFWAGAIGVHALDLDFVQRAAEHADAWLPHHASPKVVPCVGATGRTTRPREPNGLKLERFVFDALAHASSHALLEVQRDDEYAPVKNASGGESPETGRAALSACARRWLAEAGMDDPPADLWVEVDHSRIDSARDAAILGLEDYRDAPDLILTGFGVKG